MRVFNQMAAFSAVAFAAGLAFASAAIAVERDVSVLQFEVEDWLFVPTLADGAVESFVALRIEPGVGDNITTVWYLRLADSWESWAWEEQDSVPRDCEHQDDVGVAGLNRRTVADLAERGPDG